MTAGEAPPALPVRPVSFRAAALGLFVLWQLVYLPASNLLQFLPRARVPDRGEYVVETQRDGRFTPVRPAQAGYDAFGHLADRWSEFSGQTQIWNMFCQGLPAQSVSPLVTLERADGTWEEVGTSFPPSPYRLPFPGVRVHHVEANTLAGLWHFTTDRQTADPEAYREGLRVWAGARPGTVAGYMRHIAKSRPGMSPVIRAGLAMRARSKPTDGSWPTFTDFPFVRLTLADDSLDVWDPRAGAYVRGATGEWR
jgi:hypothetical protein